MKSILSLFKECLFLHKDELNLDKEFRFLDISLSDLIIYREYENYCYIIYLFSGTFLKISSKYINLIYEFQKLYYEDIINIEPTSNLEKFIKYLTIFSRMISRKLIVDNKDEFLLIVKNLCKLGTEEFINYVEENLDIDLNPWTLNTYKMEKEI